MRRQAHRAGGADGRAADVDDDLTAGELTDDEIAAGRRQTAGTAELAGPAVEIPPLAGLRVGADADVVSSAGPDEEQREAVQRAGLGAQLGEAVAAGVLQHLQGLLRGDTP